MRISAVSQDGGRGGQKIVLDEDDWKELFALYTSCTEYERRQLYQEGSPHHYKETDLSEEYTYSAEKLEYAIDAWRAVLFFLHRNGFVLAHHQGAIALDSIGEEFAARPE